MGNWEAKIRDKQLVLSGLSLSGLSGSSADDFSASKSEPFVTYKGQGGQSAGHEQRLNVGGCFLVAASCGSETHSRQFPW